MRGAVLFRVGDHARSSPVNAGSSEPRDEREAWRFTDAVQVEALAGDYRYSVFNEQ